MYKLSKEKFKQIEKFVVTKGIAVNKNRCIVISVKSDEKENNITCCMDEIDRELRICQVNGKAPDNLISALWELELFNMSENKVYSCVEEDKYKDYIEVIKMETECCDKD